MHGMKIKISAIDIPLGASQRLSLTINSNLVGKFKSKLY
jgi:hypothetical protein